LPLTVIVAMLGDKDPNTTLKVILLVLTIGFYVFVLYISVTQTVMVRVANVRRAYHNMTMVIIWSVAVSSALSLTAKNLAWMTPRAQLNFERWRQASTAFFEVSTYIAILFVVFHLYRINDRTI
jgi:uncharacterized membrane protein